MARILVGRINLRTIHFSLFFSFVSVDQCLVFEVDFQAVFRLKIRFRSVRKVHGQCLCVHFNSVFQLKLRRDVVSHA